MFLELSCNFAGEKVEKHGAEPFGSLQVPALNGLEEYNADRYRMILLLSHSNALTSDFVFSTVGLV